MKKQIYFLVSLFALMGFSSNVNAQAEVTQYNGETKTFTVTNHTDFSYQWSVYAEIPTASSTAMTATNFSILTAQSNSCSIEWKTMPVGSYYVAVKEFAGTAQTGCATTRYIKVNIAASQWNVVVVAVDATGNPIDEAGRTSCALGEGQIVANTSSLTTPDNVRYYDVIVKNGTAEWKGSWKFSYTLTGNDIQTSAVGYIKTITSETVNGYMNPSISETAAVTTAKEVLVTNGSKVRIKVTAKDNAGTDSKFTYTLPLTVSALKVGAGEVGESSGNDTDNLITYTVKTYPKTGDIIVN